MLGEMRSEEDSAPGPLPRPPADLSIVPETLGGRGWHSTGFDREENWAACRAENAVIFPRDGGWVFPSRNMCGRVTHVQQTKEARYVGNRKLTVFPSAHRLRDTFASAAHEGGVDSLSLKVLMNHTLPSAGDVTEGYIRPSVGQLRGEIEKVAAFRLERMGGGE